jgi:hypothetical protein
VNFSVPLAREVLSGNLGLDEALQQVQQQQQERSAGVARLAALQKNHRVTDFPEKYQNRVIFGRTKRTHAIRNWIATDLYQISLFRAATIVTNPIAVTLEGESLLSG